MCYTYVIVIQINGAAFEFDSNVHGDNSIVEFAHLNGIEVPTLCFLKDCGNVAKCGLCGVLVDGKKTLACKDKITDGVEIQTAFVSDPEKAGASKPNPEAPELGEFLTKRIGMLLDKHNFACGKCVRKDSCEFLDLVKLTKARANTPYRPTPEEVTALTDSRSVAITLDRSKCVQCSRCVASCAFNTTTQSITLGKLPETVAEQTGLTRAVCPALKDADGVAVPTEISFDDTNCLLCGQCVQACPVGALQEHDDTDRVVAALEDDKKHVVVAIAPAVRSSIGESFGLPAGTDTTGKIYTALRELGFDRVFDINFTADVTIMEEGTELLQRLGVIEGGHTGDTAPKFPMLTSCCPGWLRLVDKHAPELLPNLSTAKSPQQIFGAAAKAYYPMTSGFPVGVEKKDIFTVTIMPCLAKKDEATMPGMTGADGNDSPDVDAVLTTRELARLIKSRKIDFANLKDGKTDPVLGEYTGAATIFGVTGGVMEAALRSAKDLAEGTDLQEVDYYAVEGFCGVREASVEIAGNTVNVAVVNGAANFFRLRSSGILDQYHFIEVMACPGGCVNGGGQPQVDSHRKLDAAVSPESRLGNCKILSGHVAGFNDYLPDYIAKRASVLRNQDHKGNFTDKKRKSHQNIEVQAMYKALDVAPGEGIAHKLFHVDHNIRTRSNKTRGK